MWDQVNTVNLKKDIELSNRIGELSVPKGVELHVEQGLECFQNDEGSVEANDVDMIEEDLCDTSWSVTKKLY